jgi:hypothetical protein
MRKSNLQKIDELRQAVKIAVDNFIMGLFPGGLPEFYFDVLSYRGIVKHNITGSGFNFPWTNKRPTNADVEKIEKYCNRFMPTAENIFLYYMAKYSDGLGGVSGAIKVGDLTLDKGRSFVESDLFPRLAELKEKYEPRPGYIQCQYCGQQRLPADIIQDTVISPNWKNQGYKSPPRNYCKDKPCAGYDQMAHEG